MNRSARPSGGALRDSVSHTCAGFVDGIVFASSVYRQSKTILVRSGEARADFVNIRWNAQAARLGSTSFPSSPFLDFAELALFIPVWSCEKYNLGSSPPPRTWLRKDPTLRTRKTSSPNSFESASRSGNTAWFSRASLNLVGLPKR